MNFSHARCCVSADVPATKVYELIVQRDGVRAGARTLALEDCKRHMSGGGLAAAGGGGLAVAVWWVAGRCWFGSAVGDPRKAAPTRRIFCSDVLNLLPAAREIIKTAAATSRAH